MRSKMIRLLTVSLILGLGACIPTNPFGKATDDNTLPLLALLATQSGSGSGGYNWRLPAGFPTPRVPTNNPMSEEKVQLGRFLFYDKKLSGNDTMSCASCHFQHLAFADDKIHPTGITGTFHPRNSQPLFNVAYNTRQTWANTTLVTLEQQAPGPLFGEDPIELGLLIEETAIREKLLSNPRYRDLFSRSFPGESQPITVVNVIKAIASFQRSLISGNSPYDKATYQGQRDALTPSARRGLQFFSGEVAECFHCHDGVNFNDSTFHENTSATVEPLYHNNALYNIPTTGNPSHNLGLYSVTGNARHRGAFKAPSLRNIGLTFPYMHDGSISCDDNKNPHLEIGRANGATMEGCARQALSRVIDHYSNGGFNSTCSAFTAPGASRNASFPCSPHITAYGGDSNLTPNNQSNVDRTLIRKFPISAGEREDLINFLLSLTDREFTQDSRFSNPHP